MALKLIVHNTK